MGIGVVWSFVWRVVFIRLVVFLGSFVLVVVFVVLSVIRFFY